MPDFRARSTVELIDAAFQLYSRHFAIYFALGLIGGLASLANLVDRTAMLNLTTNHVGLLILAIVLLVIVILVTYGAEIILTSRLYHETPADLGQVLSRALRRLPLLLGMQFLASIVTSVGFVLLIIPGIYLFLRLCLVMPVVLLEENIPGSAALYRSAALTKGHLWKVVAVGLSLFIIIMVGAMIQGVSIAILPRSIGIVIAYLVAATTHPFLAITGTLFYYDLRVRNEGYDIQTLAGTPPLEPVTT